MTLQELKELLTFASENPRLRKIKVGDVELVFAEDSNPPTELKDTGGPESAVSDSTTIDWSKTTLYDSPDAWPGGSKPVFHRKPPVDPDLK